MSKQFLGMIRRILICVVRIHPSWRARKTNSLSVWKLYPYSCFMLTVWLITLCAPAYSRGEISVGITSGMGIPGDQDHKFKEYNSQGKQIHQYFTNDIDESTSLLNNVNISVWGTHGIWQYFGVQFDAASWAFTTTVPNMLQKTSLPFTSVKQERISLFVNLLGRFPLFSSDNVTSIHRQTYLFGGVGGGPLHTDVQHGQQGWQAGCQMFGGLSMPLFQNARFRIEGRYLLARDADVANPQSSWHVETSGTPTAFRLGRHWDTRLSGVMFGVDWRF